MWRASEVEKLECTPPWISPSRGCFLVRSSLLGMKVYAWTTTGLPAPGAVRLGMRVGGRLGYLTLSTSAISESFWTHIQSSMAFSTTSICGPGGWAAGAAGVVAVVGAAALRAGGGGSCANTARVVAKNAMVRIRISLQKEHAGRSLRRCCRRATRRAGSCADEDKTPG